MQEIALKRDEITEELRVEERGCDAEFLLASPAILIFHVISSLCKTTDEAYYMLTNITKVAAQHISQLYNDGEEESEGKNSKGG